MSYTPSEIKIYTSAPVDLTSTGVKNNADIYSVTVEYITGQILSAHRVTSPVIVGLGGQGGFHRRGGA